MSIVFLNQHVVSSATVDTTSSTVTTNKLDEKSVFVDVVTSGTAIVAIDASPDQSTWYNLDTKTYNANTSDVFSYASYLPFMRVDVSSVNAATVNVFLSGRGNN